MSFSTPDNDATVGEAASVTDMCEMIGISRSRFYALVRSGVLPQPSAYVRSSRRPVFFIDAIYHAMEVRRSNVGMNGKVVSFNAPRFTPKRVLLGVERRFEPRDDYPVSSEGA